MPKIRIGSKVITLRPGLAHINYDQVCVLSITGDEILERLEKQLGWDRRAASSFFELNPDALYDILSDFVDMVQKQKEFLLQYLDEAIERKILRGLDN